jgi:hypothetical protein
VIDAAAQRDLWSGSESNPDRVVLVGECNPYGPAEEFALYCDPPGSAGGRLRRIMGVDEGRYLAFRRLNLCSGRWSRRAAVLSAARLYDELAASRPATALATVVLLGVNVATAFSAFTVVERAGQTRPGAVGRWERGSDGLGRANWLSLPHPSGLCRVWGSGMWRPGGTVELTRRLLCEVAPHVPWGGSLDLAEGATP